jgi:hypothetical protein
VIENQYGRADYDHLTRALAYAVARRARGLVVVAEEHADEFRALAQYLNDLAELDRERGIVVWLVEARAVRVDDSDWAPLFDVVVEPNGFTANVEQAKQAERMSAPEEFLSRLASETTRAAVRTLLQRWEEAGHRLWLGTEVAVLQARGPAVSGVRSVITLSTPMAMSWFRSPPMPARTPASPSNGSWTRSFAARRTRCSASPGPNGWQAPRPDG